MNTFNKGQLLSGLFSLIDEHIDKTYGDIKKDDIFTLYNLIVEFWNSCLNIDYEYTLIIKQAFDSNLLAIDTKSELKAKLNPFNTLVCRSVIDIIIVARYLKIEADDILGYYDNLLKGRLLDGLKTNDGLSTAFNYARHNNIYDDGARVQGFHSYKVISDSEIILDFRSNLAGRKMSPELLEVIRLDLLSTLSTLSKGINNFKKDLNRERMEQEFMVSWLYFFKTLDLLSLEPKTIFYNIEQIITPNAS